MNSSSSWLLSIDAQITGPYPTHQVLTEVLRREAFDRALVAPAGESTWVAYGEWLDGKGAGLLAGSTAGSQA